MTKHWYAIAARRTANAEHQPIIDLFPHAMPGEEWAGGFAAAIQMQGHAWDRMFDDVPGADQSGVALGYRPCPLADSHSTRLPRQKSH